jgi:hypothetical protein
VDVIDVFRRPEYLPGHAAEILALPLRPGIAGCSPQSENNSGCERPGPGGLKVA